MCDYKYINCAKCYEYMSIPYSVYEDDNIDRLYKLVYRYRDLNHNRRSQKKMEKLFAMIGHMFTYTIDYSLWAFISRCRNVKFVKMETTGDIANEMIKKFYFTITQQVHHVTFQYDFVITNVFKKGKLDHHILRVDEYDTIIPKQTSRMFKIKLKGNKRFRLQDILELMEKKYDLYYEF